MAFAKGISVSLLSKMASSGIDSEEELKIAQEAFEKLTDVADEAERTHGEDEESVQDLEKITLTDENGDEKEYYVIDVFEARNRNYIALAPESNVSEYNIDVVLSSTTPIIKFTNSADSRYFFLCLIVGSPMP